MAIIEKEKSAPFDNGPVGPNGQHRDYAVLPKSERDKGFIRPVRRSYIHVGKQKPKYPLIDMTEEDKKKYVQFGYLKFEKYPESESPITGKYWTKETLAAVDNGCKNMTTMGATLAETYARDPKYYGSTFCCWCGKHLPVEEFVWEGTDERVGS